VIPLLVIGGAEKYAADICRVLQSRGVGPILVIVTDQDQQVTGEWRDLPIIAPFRSTKVLFWRDVCGAHSDPEMLGSLLAYLEPEFIVVTYSGICLQAITRYGRRLAQKSKIFCTFFGLGQDGLGAPYGVTFARFTSSFATSITDNKLTGGILDSRFDALGRPAAVIPPCVPIVLRDVFERRLSARSTRTAQNGTHSWVWVSRLDKAKGLPVLRALAELRPDDSFDLYGPSHSPPDQLGLDLPNIRLCGILKDVSLADFSRYDGFLFTSPLEGMPNIVLEVSQHGIPMIMSNAGGLPETFDSGSAIIVPTDKTVALTADAFNTACNRLISMSPASKAEMAEKAYQSVRERHSAEPFEARVRDVLGI
jgi:glycosyltransferase involved in cell wall biosynthesis